MNVRAVLLFVCPFLWSTLLDDAWGAEHKFGWKPSPHGVKAAPIETHPQFKAAPLPQAASVSEYFFPTNQGDRGACVAFSAWESYSAAWAKGHSGVKLELSPLDIYQQCLINDGNFPKDEGTYGGTAIKVLLKSGALSEKSWPYSMPLSMRAPQNWQTASERDQHKALKAYAVPNNDGGYAVKQCIANLRIPVMIGSYWYGNTSTVRIAKCKTKVGGKGATVNRYVLPYPKGRPVGGHEIPIVSFDDNMKFPDGSKGGVEIHNHWEESPGHPWGDERGCAWLPYKWAFNRRIVEDAVAIEAVKP